MPKCIKININGYTSTSSDETVTTLSAPTLDDSNSIDAPLPVIPVSTKVSNVKSNFDYTFAPYSITILRLR
jgi:alpha-N-arabinofuranosidase